ncbi:MAG TPA: hypothetical protein DEA08_29590 [Planctomycetes bacterium]|nr:hypothetical protein [Planctomycetota bacterium]|tara:strand:- start:338 stop:667 length:330 start_codon:yes stop_codon:yes gene_type:complete
MSDQPPPERDDEPEEPESGDEQPTTCCLLRRKILVGILRVLSEDECGVPDSELADVLRFDLASADGKPVLGFMFCPWCGQPRDQQGETRIVSLAPPPEPDDGGDFSGSD